MSRRQNGPLGIGLGVVALGGVIAGVVLWSRKARAAKLGRIEQEAAAAALTAPVPLMDVRSGAREAALLSGASQADAEKTAVAAMRAASAARAQATGRMGAVPDGGTPVELAAWIGGINARLGAQARSVGLPCRASERSSGRFVNDELRSDFSKLVAWNWRSSGGKRAGMRPPPQGSWNVVRAADLSLKRGAWEAVCAEDA